MTLIICELGSSPYPAWDFEPWCAAAQAVGADAAKIQLWKTDVIYPPHMREQMRPREFPRERLREFVICAHAFGLQAGASVFDLDAVTLAAEWCDWLKLAASQQDNDKLRAACLSTGKRVYRSISNLRRGQLYGETTLYAIQRYPAPMWLTLWRLWQASVWFKRQGWRWGHSSHTTGYFDCIAAANMGASVVEKHFARTSADCEALHSLLPDKFSRMVAGIRKVTR